MSTRDDKDGRVGARSGVSWPAEVHRDLTTPAEIADSSPSYTSISDAWTPVMGGVEGRLRRVFGEADISKRVMPHANVQDYLYGRYFLPPSQVYSVARLSRDGATYDIPVNAEWVTIAVVAERSDVRVSGTKSLSGRNDHDDEEDDDDDGDGAWAATTSKPKEQSMGKGKGKDKVTGAPSKQRVPRKYLNLKLVSLPSRGQPHLLSNAASGDAHLQLLLFEAEAIVHGKEGEGYSHRGGSGGAYEKWCNLGVGSIIAIVNPRVLRPLKVSASSLLGSKSFTSTTYFACLRLLLTPVWCHSSPSRAPARTQPHLGRVSRAHRSGDGPRAVRRAGTRWHALPRMDRLAIRPGLRVPRELGAEARPR